MMVIEVFARGCQPTYRPTYAPTPIGIDTPCLLLDCSPAKPTATTPVISQWRSRPSTPPFTLLQTNHQTTARFLTVTLEANSP